MQRRLTHYYLWGYLLAIVIAETLTAIGQALPGLTLHALLLLALTYYSALGRQANDRRVALALTLVPLIRILSLALPFAYFPQSVGYALVAILLLIAAGIAIRQLRLSRTDLGLRFGDSPLQVMLMGGGMGLGVLGYAILPPGQAADAFSSWQALWLSILALVILIGFAEELVFRGLLASVARPVLGGWAPVYVSLLFAALHIGSRSPMDVILAFGVGMAFTYVACWSGSILGIMLAHGLASSVMFLLMPYLERNPSSDAAAILPWAVGFGALTFGIAVAILVTTQVLPQRANHNLPIGLKIRELRRQAQVTYVDLAGRTGLSARLIAEIEWDMRPLLPEQASLIARGLGAAPDWLASVSSA